MIDISQPTPWEIESSGGYGSVKHLLETLGQIESKRRDQDILSQFVTAKASDPEKSTASILADITSKGSQYDPGLRGVFQRIASGLPGAESTVLPQLQAGQVQTPLQEQQMATLRAREIAYGAPKRPTLSDQKLRLIEKKMAADPNFEGSPEHLRLLGVSTAKLQTPEERLKWLHIIEASAAGKNYGMTEVVTDSEGNLIDRPVKIAHPKIYEWVQKELAKLPMFAEEEQVDISPVETDIWPLVPPEVGQRIQQAVKEGYKKEEILKWLKDNGYNDYAGNP